MRRSLTIKAVLILIVIVWAVYQLYPTYRVSKLKGEKAQLVTSLSTASALEAKSINYQASVGDLERSLRTALDGANGDTLTMVLDLARELEDLTAKIDDMQFKAIKRGLDLQGGIYLVYEIDTPQLLLNIAKVKDKSLEDAVKKTQHRAVISGGDFFEELPAVFGELGLSFQKYFGRRGDSDEKILSGLREEAEDALGRNLEILRNRIDQFGVSEPSITKQGNTRILLELPGVQDVERAKRIIGKTAQLEFKLEKEPNVTQRVLREINNALRRKLRTARATAPEAAESMAAVVDSADTSGVYDKKSSESEIDAATFFGQSEDLGDTSASDTSLLVAEEALEQDPFYALLREGYGGRITVPVRNVRAVERILQMDEVQEVIPPDAQFHWSARTRTIGEEEYRFLYLLNKEAGVLGAHIEDAQVSISGGGNRSMSSAGKAIVNLRMNDDGAKIFARVTGANVGRNLAIVLDGHVASNPVIRSRITGGSAQIEGMESIEEAQDLRTVLRAGALPAPIKVETEQIVGPSLGHDSIRQGQFSVILGMALVILFMFIYYRLSGLIADVALLLNVLIVMSLLAWLHATLTLPGVAGIILTIGMAVDANVLILERIREELASGKTIRAAVDAGYARAFRTIIDANITTLIAAVVLITFGTGPIKGFAVTLSFGIMASMFTAIFVTRVIYDVMLERFTIRKLSI